MARFYADEDFPGPTTRELRQLGHDVLTAREAGRADQSIPDEEVLGDACINQRILLTKNRDDFKKISNLQPLHEGIVAITQDTDFIGQAERIHKKVMELGEKIKGQFVTVNRPNLSDTKTKDR